jgi:hypothetical protein
MICREKSSVPMSAQQHPEDYAEARSELLRYCIDNEIIAPFYDYPFAWPESSLRPRSPSPELAEIIPPVDPAILNEPRFEPDGLQEYSENEILSAED